MRIAKRGSGSIINNASILGMRSVPLHTYVSAKAAVISMTCCLAAKWGRSDAVSPGHILTPALKDAIDRRERNIFAISNNTSMGRFVEPNEIMKAITFLVSNLRSEITGVNLHVDVDWLVSGSWDTYGGPRNDVEAEMA